ncbi:MAG: phosphoribosyl-AMP cyclohydrolase [Spirochaetales bacterium]
MSSPREERADPDFSQTNLLPAVAQDASTGEVLMLAWMDREAWEETLRSGYAHYHSRSRNRLWKKGETSGNVQRVVEIRVDCDEDAILLRVEQTGPACHTGNHSCFYRRSKSL